MLLQKKITVEGVGPSALADFVSSPRSLTDGFVAQQFCNIRLRNMSFKYLQFFNKIILFIIHIMPFYKLNDIAD